MCVLLSLLMFCVYVMPSSLCSERMLFVSSFFLFVVLCYLHHARLSGNVMICWVEDSPERGTVPRSSLGSEVRFDGIANRDPSTTRLGGLLSSVGVPMSGAPQPFLPQ